MSKDKNANPAEDLDLDFASFDLDGPAPAGGPDPFELEAMPGPAAPAKPARQAPSSRDHFGDIDGSGLGSHHDEPAEPDADLGGFGDFGRDEFGIPPEEEPEPAPVRARPNLRKDPVAAREPAHLADAGFGGLDDEPAPAAHAYGGGHEDDGFAESGFHDEPGHGDDGHDGGHDDGHGAFGEGHDADHGDGDDEGEAEPARSRFAGFDPKRLIFPGAAAGVALFAGIMGWNFIGGMISGPEVPRAGGALSQVGGAAPQQPQRQAALAPFPGPGGPSNQLPPMPAQPARLPPSAPAGSAAALPPTQGLPGPSVAAVNTAPPAAAAVAARSDAALTERLDRLEERVGKSAGAAAGDARVAELEQKLRVLEQRIAATENRAVPQAPKPDVVVPLKPQLVPGYTLAGYFKGTAWIQTPEGGTVEARVGTDLGAAGTVTGVSRYAKDFVVTTTVGVIMRN